MKLSLSRLNCQSRLPRVRAIAEKIECVTSLHFWRFDRVMDTLHNAVYLVPSVLFFSHRGRLYSPRPHIFSYLLYISVFLGRGGFIRFYRYAHSWYLRTRQSERRFFSSVHLLFLLSFLLSGGEIPRESCPVETGRLFIIYLPNSPRKTDCPTDVCSPWELEGRERKRERPRQDR